MIKRIESLRKTFEAVSDGYHTAYDPDWKNDLRISAAEKEARAPDEFSEEMPGDF